ncbi:hypothetical protein E3N88_12243 [Mikania micrantha]|uniref:Uncharacterized protein n=1 Tax=Mikania micrantha TaxID=192012 RepID=A0A5N6P4Y8_9ASTR|nr:hypothetical protein E3N88_12243 [Mikania micrantha]
MKNQKLYPLSLSSKGWKGTVLWCTELGPRNHYFISCLSLFMVRYSGVLGLDALSPFNPLSEIRQKEGKSIDRPHHLHPVGNTRLPKDAFGIQGSRTDHRTMFNKWNALAVLSQIGQYGSENGNHSFLKPAFLRPKSLRKRGERLTVSM